MTVPVAEGRYTVDLCTNWRKRGVARAFTFLGHITLNGTGEWSMEVAGHNLEHGTSIEDINSVIVYDKPDGQSRIVYAGITAPTASVSTGRTTLYGPSGTTYRFDGVDLFGVLDTRLTFPDPETGPPWSVSHDERTGLASNLVSEYIRHNLGAQALEGRRLPDLDIVDAATGGEITWSTRLQPLGQMVAQLCNAAGLVCRATMATPPVPVFTITTGTDRSNRVILHEDQCTGSFSILASPPASTWVLAGGEGEGTERLFATSATTATGLSRTETFYDVSNLIDQSAVQLAADGERSARDLSNVVDVANAESIPIQYPYDYDLGDTIMTRTQGVNYPAVVQGVSFNITPSAGVVRPILGRMTDDETTQLLRSVFDVSALQQSTVR